MATLASLEDNDLEGWIDIEIKKDFIHHIPHWLVLKGSHLYCFSSKTALDKKYSDCMEIKSNSKLQIFPARVIGRTSVYEFIIKSGNKSWKCNSSHEKTFHQWVDKIFRIILNSKSNLNYKKVMDIIGLLTCSKKSILDSHYDSITSLVDWIVRKDITFYKNSMYISHKEPASFKWKTTFSKLSANTYLLDYFKELGYEEMNQKFIKKIFTLTKNSSITIFLDVSCKSLNKNYFWGIGGDILLSDLFSVLDSSISFEIIRKWIMENNISICNQFVQNMEQHYTELHFNLHDRNQEEQIGIVITAFKYFGFVDEIPLQIQEYLMSLKEIEIYFELFITVTNMDILSIGFICNNPNNTLYTFIQNLFDKPKFAFKDCGIGYIQYNSNSEGKEDLFYIL